MLRSALAFTLIMAASPAWSGDTLLRGPAPEWIKPITVTPPPVDAADGSPVRILLEDTQLRFAPEGDLRFTRTVMQIRNPMGLAAVGAKTLAWSPDTDTLTVHHFRILRGGQTIDVLAKQDFEIIRREKRLESAIVDGVLSATLQPEGVQAGDVVDIAYTRQRLDPVMKGRAEDAVYARTFGRSDRVRLRAVWDSDRDIAWTAGSGLDKPKVTKSGGRTEVVVDMQDVGEVKFPVGAPPRFRPTRDLNFSEFKTWADVATLAEPYYTKASQLETGSPLHVEVEKIRTASPDPKVRASLALQLVEDQIRYLAITLQNGGYVPATADETWRRRYGDCKAKSVLLVALLRELGIEAEAALVDSTGGHSLGTRPPGMTAFDHVIVRAVVGGDVYWLDGTRSGDRDITLLRPPSFGHALPLRTAGAALIALVQPPLTGPDRGVTLRIDASKGLDAPASARGEIMLGAEMGHYLRLYSSSMPAADREKSLKQLFSSYPGIEATSVSVETDAATRVPKLVMEGVAKLAWIPRSNGPRWHVAPGASLGGATTRKREPGPNADAPWAVLGHPTWASSRYEVVLPAKGEGFRIEGADVDKTVAGRAYRRTSKIENGVAIIETSVRTVADEFPNSEAEAAAETLTEMGKVRVVIRAPSFYRATSDDIAAWGTETPKSAGDYVGRGVRYASARQYEKAVPDFDKALALDPKAAFAWANRGHSNLNLGKADLAAADFAKALDVDPRNYVAVQGQGILAMRERRFEDAATAFGRAADLAPGNTFALRAQARALERLGDSDKALAALEEAEKHEPGDVDIRAQRRELLEARNQSDRALAELDLVLKTKADDSELHLERAALLARMGRHADAAAAFERGIALRPDRVAYLSRLYSRHPGDIAGRLADVELAEKAGAEPLPDLRVQILGDAGRYDEALATADRGLKAKPDNYGLAVERVEILLLAGRVAEAARAIQRLRPQAAGDVRRLNNLCWMGGTRNHDLEAALRDCDAALKIDPDNGPTADSRGLVLLRLNRPKDAIAAYDLALMAMPRNAESLYGRGLARLALGASADAEADFTAARRGAPFIDIVFEGWGLRAPAIAAPPKTTASD